MQVEFPVWIWQQSGLPDNYIWLNCHPLSDHIISCYTRSWIYQSWPLKCHSADLLLSLIFSFTEVAPTHCVQKKKPHQVGNNFNFKVHSDSYGSVSNKQLCSLWVCLHCILYATSKRNHRDAPANTSHVSQLKQPTTCWQIFIRALFWIGLYPGTRQGWVSRTAPSSSLCVAPPFFTHLWTPAQPATLKPPRFIWAQRMSASLNPC